MFRGVAAHWGDWGRSSRGLPRQRGDVNPGRMLCIPGRAARDSLPPGGGRRWPRRGMLCPGEEPLAHPLAQGSGAIHGDSPGVPQPRRRPGPEHPTAGPGLAPPWARLDRPCWGTGGGGKGNDGKLSISSASACAAGCIPEPGIPERHRRPRRGEPRGARAGGTPQPPALCSARLEPGWLH